MKIQPIEVLQRELPNVVCAVFYNENQLKENFKKVFGREPEVAYIHRTGFYVPISAEEYQTCKSMVSTRVPEE